jgi:anti-sigma B factor antagonist
MQFGTDPQMGLNVSSGVRQGALVVRVRGELDYRSASILRSELGGVWEMPGISTIVLDVDAVTFCDSVGLSELIAALRRSQMTGHTLMMSGLQGPLLRVLTITGLRDAFEAYDTVDDALRHSATATEPHPATPSILDSPAATSSAPEPSATASITAEPVEITPTAMEASPATQEGPQAGAVVPQPGDGLPPDSAAPEAIPAP